MTNEQQRQESVCHFPEVAELLENILLNLSTQDITRTIGVCSFWKACIGGSRPLMRKLHKLSMRLEDGDNPHFDELTEARTAVIPRFEFQGKNLWNLVRFYEDGQLTKLHEVTEDYRKTEQYRKEINELSEEYWDGIHDIRAGFMDVRIPDGWPIGLRELHCDLCDGWHTNFQFENLHPLLGFLGDMTMCFRGYGSQFMINISTVAAETAPKACFEHSCVEAIDFAKGLRKACKAVEGGGVGKDFFTQPAVTKIATSGGWVIESETGLTLEKTVPFILKLFRGHLVSWRAHCHIYETTQVTLWSRARRDNIATYPTLEDWDAHMAAYSDITKLWEDMIAEVDVLMSDVSIWVSVLAQDVEVPIYSSISL